MIFGIGLVSDLPNTPFFNNINFNVSQSMTSRFEILTGISSILTGCSLWATQLGEETLSYFAPNRLLLHKNLPWDFNIFAHEIQFSWATDGRAK